MSALKTTSYDPALPGQPIAHDQARALLGLVMGLVAFTRGFLAVGAYAGRDRSGGLGITFLDEEAHRLVDEPYAEVPQLLSGHRDEFDDLAHALLEAETLDAPDAYAAAGIPIRRTEVRDLTGAGSLT